MLNACAQRIDGGQADGTGAGAGAGVGALLASGVPVRVPARFPRAELLHRLPRRPQELPQWLPRHFPRVWRARRVRPPGAPPLPPMRVARSSAPRRAQVAEGEGEGEGGGEGEGEGTPEERGPCGLVGADAGLCGRVCASAWPAIRARAARKSLPIWGPRCLSSSASASRSASGARPTSITSAGTPWPNPGTHAMQGASARQPAAAPRCLPFVCCAVECVPGHGRAGRRMRGVPRWLGASARHQGWIQEAKDADWRRVWVRGLPGRCDSRSESASARRARSCARGPRARRRAARTRSATAQRKRARSTPSRTAAASRLRPLEPASLAALVSRLLLLQLQWHAASCVPHAHPAASPSCWRGHCRLALAAGGAVAALGL